MRRRPQIHGRSSSRCAGPLVGASPGVSLNSFALFCDRDFSLRGKSECNAGPGGVPSPAEANELLHRALRVAIDRVTAKFEEAQSEYQLVTANSCDRYKRKGQMIAYANVVTLLEDLKSHPALAE